VLWKFENSARFLISKQRDSRPFQEFGAERRVKNSLFGFDFPLPRQTHA